MMKHRVVMVMGVAGAGKTAIGRALADHLNANFFDADDYHPKANVTHMTAGKPLTDNMRWPWLDLLGDAVKEGAQQRETVFACSGLKRIYRDYLRAGLRYELVYLDAPFEVVSARIAARKSHFMPAKLIRSQYTTLQPPTKDETPITVEVADPVSEIVTEIASQLALRG